jgi:hypothetical protein
MKVINIKLESLMSTLIRKIKPGAWSVVQMIESLPNKFEALSSNPNTSKKKE